MIRDIACDLGTQEVENSKRSKKKSQTVGTTKKLDSVGEAPLNRRG